MRVFYAYGRLRKQVRLFPDEYGEYRYVFTPASRAAAIDKRGGLTVKSDGCVYILVYNQETQHGSCVELEINSRADGLAGKRNIKLKAGNRVRLTEYLTYKQGKITLESYCRETEPDLAVALSGSVNPSYELKYDRNEEGKVTECWIVARKADPRPFTITVGDRTVRENGGKDIEITFTAAAADPVKSLKARDVVDRYGYVTFTHTGGCGFQETPDGERPAFRIEVKDSKGRLIKSETVNPDVILDGHKGNPYLYRGSWYADAKHTKHQYKYKVTDLTCRSSCTVSVTAVYGDGREDDGTGTNQTVSRTVSTRLKTTDTPVVREDMGLESTDYDGGAELYVGVRDDKQWKLSDYPLLKSGGQYTLSFDRNDGRIDGNAVSMKTDTLIWKSSDPKTVSVKGNPGACTAKLGALRKGTATISVTSKVTKKLIAKWRVVVNAVGEEEGRYADRILAEYGLDHSGSAAKFDALGAEVLTENSPLSFKLKYGEGRWVVFTAPEYGNYGVNIETEPDGYDKFIWEYTGGRLETFSGSTRNMEKGQKRFFYVAHEESSRYYKMRSREKSEFIYTFRAFGTRCPTVTIGGSHKVKAGDEFRFTAPEDNFYTVTYVKGEERIPGETFSLSQNRSRKLTAPGDLVGEYRVEITRREPVELALNKTAAVALDAGAEQWVEFTAAKTDRYLYTIEGAENCTVYKYRRLEDESGVETAPMGEEVYRAGQKQLFRIKNNSEKTDGSDGTAKVTFTIAEVKPVDFAGNQADAGMKEGEGRWFRFQSGAKSSGKYRFKATARCGGKTARAVFTRYTFDLKNEETIPANGPVLDDMVIDAGAYLYLYVEAAAEGEGTSTSEIKVALTAEEKTYPLGGGENTVDVAAGSHTWVYFKAETAGIYQIRVSGVCRAGCYTDINSDTPRGEYDDQTPFMEVVLMKEETVYLRLDNPAREDARETVTITKTGDIRELAAGGSDTVRVTDTNPVWYIVTADDGVYEIAADDDGVSLQEFDAPGGNALGAACRGRYIREFGRAERAYIKVSAEKSYDGRISVTRSYKRREYQVTESGLAVTIPCWEEAWLVWKPASGAAARYSFAFENTNAENHNRYEAAGYSGVDDEQYEESIFFGNGSVGEHIRAVPADSEETLQMGPEGVTRTIPAGGEKWFVLNAEEAGTCYCSFTSALESGSFCTAQRYRDLEGTNEAGTPVAFRKSNPGGGSLELEKGDSYWKITNPADSAAAVTVRMRKDTDIVLSEDEAAAAVIWPNTGQWFRFTAAKAARYGFTVADTADGAGNARAEFYSARNTGQQNHLGSAVSGKREIELDSGGTVYCYVYGASGTGASDRSVRVTAAVEKIPHQHDYRENRVEPTCTEDGYVERICSCGDSAGREVLKAAGHSYGQPETVNPTCTKDGYTVRI